MPQTLRAIVAITAWAACATACTLGAFPRLDAAADHASDSAPEASDASDVRDVPPLDIGPCGVGGDAGPDAPVGLPACPCGRLRCGLLCADVFHDISNCGGCGVICAGADHARPVCREGYCETECAAAYEPSPSGCVRSDSPRLIAPGSTSRTTSRRPHFRWELPASADGAHVQICATRSCDRIDAEFDATGSSGQPSTDLTPGVHFWRAFRLRGSERGATPSATWEVVVPRRSAPVDSSWGSLPDVDLDGHADLLVGAIRYDFDSGHAYVFLSRNGAFDTQPSRELFARDGRGGYFGDAIESVGDLDGDGYPEVAVGATLLNPEGKIHVYRGGPNGIDDAPIRSITTMTYMHHVGASMQGGDVDGDGYSDLIFAGRYSRRVFVVFGSETGPDVMRSQNAAVPLGELVVGRTGDVNGDGFADISAGAWESRGRAGVIVFFGSATGIGAQAFAQADPFGMDHEFGHTDLSGDLDGDGYADLVVGAPAVSGAVGSVSIYPGGPSGLASTASLVIMSPEGRPDWYGSAVSAHNDVNGDGFDDLVVGAPYGGMSGEGVVFAHAGGDAGVSSAPLGGVPGYDGAGGQFGIALGIAGDFDDDGFDDIFAGEPIGSGEEGRVFLMLGARMHGLGATPAAEFYAPDLGILWFGHAIAERAAFHRLVAL